MNRFTQLFMASLAGSAITLAAFQWYQKEHGGVTIEHVQGAPIASVAYGVDADNNAMVLDFTGVADKVTPTVVYVQSIRLGQDEDQLRNPFRDFFYHNPMPDRGPSRNSGSGVIVSEKGYIVTNRHVVRGTDRVRVTLSDNTTFEADVVGEDKDTDIALLKIDKEGLPYLSFANSDQTKVGQWVLAVGNPFNLNSTVTAGIISAKGRNINIIGSRDPDRSTQGNTAIESFIQTDAAINPGNSGGALVDLQGGLIGINTAIASPTGAYSGYGFAVPSNIASKVVEDLIAYGVVQRGWLGVTIQSVTGDLAKSEDLDESEGAYIIGLADNSAAKEAGLKVGDVVTRIDDVDIKSNVTLIEYIGTKRPGDEVQVTVDRDGKELTIPVELKNREGTTAALKPKKKSAYVSLGLRLEEMSEKQLRQLDLAHGVQVSSIESGGRLSRYTNMRAGFIITHVDNQKVSSAKEVEEMLAKKKKGELITFAGIYEDFPREYIYALRM